METTKNQVSDQKASESFSPEATQIFLDEKVIKILPYEKWVKINTTKLSTKIGCAAIAIAFGLWAYTDITNEESALWAILKLLVSFVFLAATFQKGDITKEAYQKYVDEKRSEHVNVKARRAQIQENLKHLEEQKTKSIELNKKPFFIKVEKIESNLKVIESLELHKVGVFKKSLGDFENQIVEKSNSDTLQKFVRVGKFLVNVEAHLNDTRISMFSELKSVNLRKRILFELEKSPKQLEKEKLEFLTESLENSVKVLEGKSKNNFGSYSSGIEKVNNILDLMVKSSKKSINLFEQENEQLIYLESVAVSMLIFLMEDRKVMFFELLEFFDGLGALDSSWEKKIKDGINGIKISLDNLNDSITGLSDSVNKLTSQNDLILKELGNIDSTLKFGNLIQSVTAYNTYKIKKGIQS